MFICSTFAQAQTIAFEFQANLDSPIALVKPFPQAHFALGLTETVFSR